MKLEEYKEAIRKYRGHLKSMDEELEKIFTYGILSLIAWSLTSKRIGVGKMARIADLPASKQDEFIKWVSLKKRTSYDIDIKLMELE